MMKKKKTSEMEEGKHTHETSHSAISLHALALMIEILAGGLRRASQQAAHHHRPGAKRQRFHDVSQVADAAVRDDGHAEFGRELGQDVHSRRLRPPHRHDFLRDANRTRAHADAERIGTRLDQLRPLLAGDDVSCDDFKKRECLFDPQDKLDLKSRVSLGRIDHDDVQASLDEEG
jgi:hypothetical protein